MATIKQEEVNGYLYSFRNNTLKVYQGQIIRRQWGTGAMQGRFHGANRILNCSAEEGVIMNSTVWFTEPNEKEAIEILIDHETDMIDDLYKKIAGRKERIDVLLEMRKPLLDK